MSQPGQTSTQSQTTPPPVYASPKVIEISALRYRWSRTDPDVLDIPELRVSRGERLFIEGPSGSGKSTLLGLLSGVITTERGELTVLGRSLAGLRSTERDRFRADHIGYIFQMFNLLPYLSMVENVVLPCRFSAIRKAKALANSASLQDEAMRLLTHLDLAHPDLLSRPVTTLSVGQQQRVAAARALMGSPELLIADEPTSSLDADRRQAFVELLFDECQNAGATLVFVSHDAALEKAFDRRFRLHPLPDSGATGAQLAVGLSRL